MNLDIADHEYPNLFNGELKFYGRILTLICIACIDGGNEVFGVNQYSEEELQDYFDVNTHRYFMVTPRGNLQKSISILDKMLQSSLKNGELKPVVLRRNLLGDISMVNSWIYADDFQEWCDSYGIHLGHNWTSHWRSEMEILHYGLEEQAKRRRSDEGLSKEDLGIEEDMDAESLRAKLDQDSYINLYNELLESQHQLNRYRYSREIVVQENLKPRSETTYLNIIGAMLELLKSPRVGRENDVAIIEEIVNNYSDKPGISSRTLQDKFALAKRTLISS